MSQGAPPGSPRMVIVSQFLLGQTLRNMTLLRARLQQLEQEIQRLQQVVDQANNANTRSTRRGVNQQILTLFRLRWTLVTMRFFFVAFGRAASSAYESLSEAAEQAATRGAVQALAETYQRNMSAIVDSIMEVANGVLTVQEAVQIAQSGLIRDQGQFAEQYASLWEAARVAAVTSGIEATTWFEAFIQALAEGDAKVIDSQANIFQAQLALQDYARSMGTTVDALDDSAKQQIILNTVLDRTQELLNAGAREALEHSDSIKRTAAAWATLRDVIGTLGHTLIETGGGLEAINRLLITMSQVAIIAAARMAYANAVIKRMQPGGVPLGVGPPALIAARAVWGLIKGPEEGEEETPQEAYNRVLMEGARALGMFPEEGMGPGMEEYRRFEEEKSQRGIDSMVDHMLKRQSLQDEYQKRLVDIEQKHYDDRQRALDRYNERVEDIERGAARDRARQHRNYERRLRDRTERHHLDRENDLQKHLQRLEHLEQRYRLRSVQNQRMYEYERMMLVAEGDVLAIEDLDARYALEQRAREEDFNLERRQEQEQFDLRQDEKKEQFQLELDQIRQALDDQLEEINIRRQEQLEDAERARDRDLQAALDAYRQRIRDEQEGHRESLRQWNQHWAKLAEQAEMGANEVRKILVQYFGEGGLLETIMQDFQQRATERARIRSMITGALPIVTAKPTTNGERVLTGDPVLDRWYYLGGYQHGGAGVVRRPSFLTLGEGYQPEAFSVMPLGGGSSRLELSWSGGPIPVQGSGLGSVDTTNIGNAIAQGLVFELRNQLASRRV